MHAVFETDLPLPNRRRGKVRDVYESPAAGASAPALVIVATDRISAFDVIMPTPIPGKGSLLTEISTRWFRLIEERGLARTHLLSTSADDVPGLSADQRAQIRGRVTIGRRCRVVPIECVVRGYLAGSGWKEYRATGAVCGVRLPAGLRKGERLMDAMGGPIFTPATKEEHGHDENIDFARASAIAGESVMRRLREASIAIYLMAHEYALSRGLILADTKFEFGFPIDAAGRAAQDEPMLVDEALTPDSSRYWPAEGWSPGDREQPSFDKQYLRDYLETLVSAGKWAKSPPGPDLPPDVVRNTAAKYQEARERLFG